MLSTANRIATDAPKDVNSLLHSYYMLLNFSFNIRASLCTPLPRVGTSNSTEYLTSHQEMNRPLPLHLLAPFRSLSTTSCPVLNKPIPFMVSILKHHIWPPFHTIHVFRRQFRVYSLQCGFLPISSLEQNSAVIQVQVDFQHKVR